MPTMTSMDSELIIKPTSSLQIISEATSMEEQDNTREMLALNVSTITPKWKLCPYCHRVEISQQQIQTLQNLLPDSTTYILCQYHTISTQPDAFKVIVRSAVATLNDLELWLQEFKIKSKTTMRVRRTNRCSHGIQCNKTFRCQHNTRPKSKTADRRLSSKNTGCPAELVIALSSVDELHQNTQRRRPRQIDLHNADYPLRIRLRFEHNHPIHTASTLRHRDVGSEAALRITNLLGDGHGPSAALERYKAELQERYGNDYVYKAGDRHHCPDLQWCYHLYQKLFKRNYGDHTLVTPQSQLQDLQEHIERYNTEMQTNATHAWNGISDAVNERHDGPLKEDFVRMTTIKEEVVIALCTPLMKRVHRLLRNSAEIVFMDASGNVDRQNVRIFLLLTHSVAGGLPLGALIVTSESQPTITAALRLYNTLLDSTCYNGRGANGPQIFMTDDSLAERNAIHDVYPGSVLLLCTFHILQAVWRFIWNNRSDIVAKEDRAGLYSKIRDLVYASSIDRLNALYESHATDNLFSKYPRVREYVGKIWERRREWAVCFRQDLPTRDNNTNNYCEAAMRVLKDNILLRTRAFNIQQLVDFIITRLDAYYQRRVLDVANNCLDHVLESKFMPASHQVDISNIIQISETEFDVPKHSSITGPTGKFFRVDTSIDMCSCSKGRTGGPCIHQQTVAQHYKLRSWNTMPINDPGLRQLLYIIATGNRSVPVRWFRSLKPVDEVSKTIRIMNFNDTPTFGNSIYDDITCSSPSLGTLNMTISPNNTKVYSSSCFPIAKRFRSSMESILQKYEENPLSLDSALTVFCTQIESLDTVASLAAALASFASPPASINEEIEVQPSSVGRRKMPIGGRRRIFAGRPPKSRYTIEHGYGVTPRILIGALGRRVVPQQRNIHDLAETVARDQRLGGTHSAK